MSQMLFSEEGWEHYLYWQGQDPKTLRKINRLLQSISRDGALHGEGKPERLKYQEGCTADGLTPKTVWFTPWKPIRF